MHAVIVGSGRVGAELAESLTQRGFTIAVIDKKEASFEKLHPGFTGKKLIGYGFDRDTLEEAGIREAQVFMAVTNGDNSNIVSARIAKEYYEIPKVVARIYDPRRARIYERLGISTVAIVAWTTDQILARVLPPSESVEWTIGSGEVVMVGTQAPAALVGEPIATLNSPGKFQVAALSRFGETVIPDEKTVIQESDFMHLSVMRTSLDELDAKLKGPEGDAH